MGAPTRSRRAVSRVPRGSRGPGGRAATVRALRARAVPPQPGSPDPVLFLAVVCLVAVGIVMVASSSAAKSMEVLGDRFYYLKRQAIWAALGLVGALFTSRLKYWHWMSLARPALILTIVLLVLVLVPGVGRSSREVQRWLGYGSLAFQPSELAKVTMTIFAAYHLSRREGIARDFWRGVVPLVLWTGLAAVLILEQPDLGTAVTVGGTLFLGLVTAGARLSHLLLLGVGAVPVTFWAIFAEEYRRQRFLAFLDPWADPQGAGFHIIQALYALGCGRLFGVGLGESRQKLWYLPEEHTDFIFAIIGEELGLVGALVVVGLFFLFAWRGFRAAMHAPDTFSSLLAAGLTGMITLQAVVNIGVVSAVLPITGIPLPFISYGGSSLVFSLAAAGIILNVSRYTRGSGWW
ncbi:MAG: putative lipid II flippase FtsW [Firmicutes bacterium]|nr:putative lipid II flippase FtsW [Bacillota bacterium]